MEQPDGSKQADREAENVAAEERAEFERWQAERAATPSSEIVQTIPDSEIGLDEDNDTIDKRNGRLVERLDDGAWAYAPEWPHQSFEYKGHTWDYREPKPLASIFFAKASDPNSRPMEKLRAILAFLEHTLSPKAHKRLQRLAFDHEAEFDQSDMSEIVRMIAEADTGRPTGRS